MSRQVTITLGSSGQVVKRSQDGFSRGKRSLTPTNSQPPLHKRVRGDKDAGGSRYGGRADAWVGQGDLRLKLIRRRRQREILEERRKEMHKKLTQSAGQSHRRLVTIRPPSPAVSPLLQMEAIRSSYAVGVRPRSPNRLAKQPREISSLRDIPTARQVPSIRPVEASRATRLLPNDLLNPHQLKAVTPVAPGNSISGLSSANRSMLDQTPFSVTSLLNSLGLGKYAIHFQAEEIDMAALKQMGDRDLKDLGIPMGPRKKILLAMLPQTRRPVM